MESAFEKHFSEWNPVAHPLITDTEIMHLIHVN